MNPRESLMVALISTLHDPDGRMVPAMEMSLPALRVLYEQIIVVPTPATSPELLGRLEEATVALLPESAGAIGTGRRHALRLGLESGASRLHYCDFDRVLHWVRTYPSELASALEAIGRHDYLIIGRTARAFSTHPQLQVETEQVTNHAFSRWFGQEVDVAAGSCGASRQGAEWILRRSVTPSNATDAEWPAIVKCRGGRVGYLATEGLEFETPDYYPEELSRAGSLEAWLEARSETLEGWIPRTRLALESLEAALAVIRCPEA